MREKREERKDRREGRGKGEKRVEKERREVRGGIEHIESEKEKKFMIKELRGREKT